MPSVCRGYMPKIAVNYCHESTVLYRPVLECAHDLGVVPSAQAKHTPSHVPQASVFHISTATVLLLHLLR